MRRILKTIVAASLCIGIIFSSSVGANAAVPETQLEATNSSTSTDSQMIIFSGQTNFDNPYIYRGSEYSQMMCFTLENSDSKYYAGITEEKYWYFQNTFKGKSLTLEGEYWGTAEDGTPVIKPIYLVEGENRTNLADYLWPFYKGTKKNPNFTAYIDIYGLTTFAEVADDNSYIKYDTNPLNLDSESYAAKILTAIGGPAIEEMNAAFGLPDWLYDEMLSTRAVDGKQKEEFDYLVVTWTYSPNQGLEIMYRLK